MSGTRLDISWRAPGPVAAAFMADRSRISVINGPPGSGKTTTVGMKLIKLAGEQRISLHHTARGPSGTPVPVRQFRVAAVRDTYRQLWRTTIPSWFERVPRSIGHFTGADGAPAHHVVPFALADGSMIEFEIDFIAIGDNSVEDALRGYQVTGFWLNEMDLCAEEIFDYALTRIPRWPPAAEGGATWSGILGDLNAPALNSWTYKRLFKLTAEQLAANGTALFRQPSGLSAHAENLANLQGGAEYYRKMVVGMPEWMIRKTILNIPGYSRAGKPVYPEFNDAVHVAASPIEIYPKLPLRIGLDAGGHPAAVFTQRLASTRWNVLDELTGEPGTGARRFGRMIAERLRQRFPLFGTEGYAGIEAWADPSATYGADKKAGEQDWTQIVAAEAGIRVRPAPTNNPTARWEAVRLPLAEPIEDFQPRFQLDPRCVVLRAGFNAEYRFRKMNTADERYDEQAEKNDASHPHDALQYVLSGGGEDQAIRARRGEEKRRGDTLRRTSPAYHPYGAHP